MRNQPAVPFAIPVKDHTPFLVTLPPLGADQPKPPDPSTPPVIVCDESVTAKSPATADTSKVPPLLREPVSGKQVTITVLLVAVAR